MINIKKSTKEQKGVFWALAALMLRGSIADVFKVYSLENLEILINVVAIALFVAGLFYMFSNYKKMILLTTTFFALLWLCTLWLFPQNAPYLKAEYIQFFIYCLPFLWVGYYLVKEAIYLEFFLPIARLKLVLSLFVQLMILSGYSQDIFNGDYQTAAYSIVVGLIGVYYLAATNKKTLDITLSIVGTIVLFLVGSRSIFISILFFWIFYFIQNSKAKSVVWFSLLGILLLIFDYRLILSPLAQLAESVGFSTHLTESLMSGTIFSDENRDFLYLSFYDALCDKPWGYGIMGDRYISYHSGFYWKPIYPHNIILELMVDFGFFVGGIIAILLFFYLFKFMLYKQDPKYSAMILVISSTCIIKLLFASTFWGDQLFFLLLGTMISYKYTNNKQEKLIS